VVTFDGSVMARFIRERSIWAHVPVPVRYRSRWRDVRTLRLALASTPRLAGDCKGEAMIPPSVDPGHAALVFARAQAAPACRPYGGELGVLLNFDANFAVVECGTDEVRKRITVTLPARFSLKPAASELLP